MTSTKKIFIFGLFIFLSLLFFSSVHNALAQSCPDTCTLYSSCSAGCDLGSYDCDTSAGETCCDMMCSAGGGGGSVCNNDNYCDALGGEDATNCPADCGGGGGGGGTTGGGVAVNCFDVYGANIACDSSSANSCLDSNWVAVTCPSAGGATGGGTCTSDGECYPQICSPTTHQCVNTSTGGGGGGVTGAETCGVFTAGTCIPTTTACSNPITVGLCNTAGTSCCANGAFNTGTGNGTGNGTGINTVPGAQNSNGITIGGVNILPPGSELGLPDPAGGIPVILTNLLKWLVIIFGVVAMIGFFISGIQYVVAAGNEGVMESAKRNMTYSIIGVIVGLSGYIIIRAIQAALTANSLF